MPRACRICPRLGIRCPVSASRLRATRASPHRSSRQGARQRRKPQRKLRSDGDLRRYGGGGPLRPYTRSDGAPNCAPSLRSVAGLLCRSLAAAREDILTSLHNIATALASDGRALRVFQLLALMRPPGLLAPGSTFFSPAGEAERRACVARERLVVRGLCSSVSSIPAEVLAPAAVLFRISWVRRAGCPRSGFSKRARGGNPRPSRARERC